MMSEEARVRQLDKDVATLTTELRAHMAYCEARMRVLWKLATALSGGIALIVSLAVAFIKP